MTHVSGPASTRRRTAPDRNEIDDALRLLRKTLRRGADLRVPETVHTLRKRVRRVEAVIRELVMEEGRLGKRLLQDLKPVRKLAGRVRDMDVMAAALLGLPADGQVVSLLELIGSRRVGEVGELDRELGHARGGLRRRLKRCRRVAGRHLEPAHALEMEESLAGEIARWPRLGVDELHDFRLRVKALLETVNLSGHADAKLVETLTGVKDAIGDWHDWQELWRLAGERFEDDPSSRLVRRIHAETTARQRRALALARGLRRRYAKRGQSGKG